MMKQSKRATYPGLGTAGEVRAAVEAMDPGTVFTTRDLLEDVTANSRSALDLTLKRMVDEEKIARAGRGLFFIPEEHPVIGRLSPSRERLAQALARWSGGELLPVGPDAANSLGLSTQVVAKPVFFTTDRSRRRRVGNDVIELRKRVPRASADPVLAQTIEALRAVGKERAGSDEIVERLRATLDAAQRTDISQHRHLAPAWMWPILERVAA